MDQRWHKETLYHIEYEDDDQEEVDEDELKVLKDNYAKWHQRQEQGDIVETENIKVRKVINESVSYPFMLIMISQSCLPACIVLQTWWMVPRASHRETRGREWNPLCH